MQTARRKMARRLTTILAILPKHWNKGLSKSTLSKETAKKVGNLKGDKEHIGQGFGTNHSGEDNIPRQSENPRQHSKEADHATGAQQPTIGLHFRRRRLWWMIAGLLIQFLLD